MRGMQRTLEEKLQEKFYNSSERAAFLKQLRKLRNRTPKQKRTLLSLLFWWLHK